LEDNPRLLWGYVEVALKPHRAAGEARSMETLNRLYRAAAAEAGLPPGPPLARATCGVRNEHWSLDRIAAALPRRAAGEPALDSVPLLAVRRADGTELIVDGARRAEKLIRLAAPGPHSVVVIESP
jgi:hypothetical protein